MIMPACIEGGIETRNGRKETVAKKSRGEEEQSTRDKIEVCSNNLEKGDETGSKKRILRRST